MLNGLVDIGSEFQKKKKKREMRAINSNVLESFSLPAAAAATVLVGRVGRERVVRNVPESILATERAARQAK
jgi:hypothetical protein